VIDIVDGILRDLIESRLPGLDALTQVAFEPPTEDWRTAVVAAGEERVNFYLYDLRENTKLRSNERHREPQAGWYLETQAPPRLDCHYLVTAWSPMTMSLPMAEPTKDEHALLYAVLEVLMRNSPLTPREVYKAGPAPSGNDINSVPDALRDHALPLEVALADGLKGVVDFWSTMKMHWKPALHLTVTIPVILVDSVIESAMVTTVVTDHRQPQDPSSAEVVVALGGHVFTPPPAPNEAPSPLKGAWVQLRGLEPPELQAVNRRLITRADGRFLFTRLRAGRYRLRAVATGWGELPREVDVPSETGEYDLQFS
jgi:hypothetical protein